MFERRGVPRECQTLRLPESRLAALNPWAVDGTALTAAARVRDPDGRTALVRNGWSDGWLPPGGAVEAGESPAEAAQREVAEETGLGARVGDPVLVVDQTYVREETEEPAFTAEYVLFGAGATGTIPDARTLGIEGESIRAARWFGSLPAALHDDGLLRPYLRRENR